MTGRFAVILGSTLALLLVVLLELPKLKAEPVPLRNNGKLDPKLKLEGVVDLVNRSAGNVDIPLHPHPIKNGSVSFGDKEHLATLGFTISGASTGKKAPMIFAQTSDGEYLLTTYGEPIDGEFSGAAFLSVRPNESFYLVAREGTEEVGRWMIKGLTPSADQAVDKERRGFAPQNKVGYENPPPNPAVKCTLEEFIEPVADGYTRGYIVHSSLSKSHPNETLDGMMISSRPQDLAVTFGMSDSDTFSVTYPNDRKRFISVYGKFVTLPGNPIPVRFHRVGPFHWEAKLGRGKMVVRRSTKLKDSFEYELDQSTTRTILMFKGHAFGSLGETRGHLYDQLTDSDFSVDSFELSHENIMRSETFRNIIDASQPHPVKHLKPLRDLNGGLDHLAVVMYIDRPEDYQ